MAAAQDVQIEERRPQKKDDEKSTQKCCAFCDLDFERRLVDTCFFVSGSFFILAVRNDRDRAFTIPELFIVVILELLLLFSNFSRRQNCLIANYRLFICLVFIYCGVLAADMFLIFLHSSQCDTVGSCARDLGSLIPLVAILYLLYSQNKRKHPPSARGSIQDGDDSEETRRANGWAITCSLLFFNVTLLVVVALVRCSDLSDSADNLNLSVNVHVLQAFIIVESIIAFLVHAIVQFQGVEAAIPCKQNYQYIVIILFLAVAFLIIFAIDMMIFNDDIVHSWQFTGVLPLLVLLLTYHHRFSVPGETLTRNAAVTVTVADANL